MPQGMNVQGRLWLWLSLARFARSLAAIASQQCSAVCRRLPTRQTRGHLELDRKGESRARAKNRGWAVKDSRVILVGRFSFHLTVALLFLFSGLFFIISPWPFCECMDLIVCETKCVAANEIISGERESGAQPVPAADYEVRESV